MPVVQDCSVVLDEVRNPVKVANIITPRAHLQGQGSFDNEALRQQLDPLFRNQVPRVVAISGISRGCANEIVALINAPEGGGHAFVS